MPFTPYHLGPSSWIGLIFSKSLNVPFFLIFSIVIDIEPALVLIFNLNLPLHGLLHSFLGGTIFSFVFLAVGYALKEKIIQKTDFFHKDSFNKISFSCLLGIYSHVFLDVFLYTDIKPFYPININPLYCLVSSKNVYSFCGFSFILGGLIYMFKRSKKKIL